MNRPAIVPEGEGVGVLNVWNKKATGWPPFYLSPIVLINKAKGEAKRARPRILF